MHEEKAADTVTGTKHERPASRLNYSDVAE